MTTHNNGGPAFPCEVGPASDGHTIQAGNMQWMQPGMTLRDYFAAKAMQGMLANPNQDYAPLTIKAQEAVVAGAYEMSDAMLKARESLA